MLTSLSASKKAMFGESEILLVKRRQQQQKAAIVIHYCVCVCVPWARIHGIAGPGKIPLTWQNIEAEMTLDTKKKIKHHWKLGNEDTLCNADLRLLEINAWTGSSEIRSLLLIVFIPAAEKAVKALMACHCYIHTRANSVYVKNENMKPFKLAGQ